MTDKNPEEFDVERINVRGSDGKVRIVISNEARFPDPIIAGREYKGARASSHPGFVFYNDVGDECGGLVFHGGPDRKTREGWQWASSSLLFDRYGGDQVLRFGYGYTDGRESYGMTCWDYLENRVQRFFAGRDSAENAVVALSDKQGRTKLVMRVDAEGVPRIEFFNDEGELVYSLAPTEAIGQ